MATHWISSVVTPKSFCMVRMATLTMLMSSTDMNIPAISTTSGRPHPPDDVSGAAGPAPTGVASVPEPIELSDAMSRFWHGGRGARIVGR